MSHIGLLLLILIQIGIDIAIFIVFIFLLKKLRYFNTVKLFDNSLKTFESLLNDADITARQFGTQLEEKQQLVRSLNDQLEKRITSLKGLLNRSDVLLSSGAHHGSGESENRGSLNGQQAQILELSQEGHGAEEIATKLSIPQEEVRLILDLKEKFSQIGSKG